MSSRRDDDDDNMTIKKSSDTRFFIPKTKIAFLKLRKIFTKTPILYYFEPDWYIQIETNTFRYAIREFFSQLTSEIR